MLLGWWAGVGGGRWGWTGAGEGGGTMGWLPLGPSCAAAEGAEGKGVDGGGASRGGAAGVGGGGAVSAAMGLAASPLRKLWRIG